MLVQPEMLPSMRIHMRGDLLVHHLQEVLQRHVGGGLLRGAVAAAVPAVESAAEGRFPEELPRGKLLHLYLPIFGEEVQS
jgi:hypothetical protein